MTDTSIRDKQAYTALGFVEYYADHPHYLPRYIAARLYEVAEEIKRMALPSSADLDAAAAEQEVAEKTR